MQECTVQTVYKLIQTLVSGTREDRRRFSALWLVPGCLIAVNGVMILPADRFAIYMFCT